MTKKEQLQMDTLRAQLKAEQDRSDKAFAAYREILYQMVEYKIKLERIERVMSGEE